MMELIILFAKGAIIGFSSAAPIGPIGLLCIQRTLEKGRIYGLISGLGVASADTLCALVVGFGLSAVSNILTKNQTIFQLSGGTMLLGLGVLIFFSKPNYQPCSLDQVSKITLVGAYLSTFLLTAIHPITIAYFGIVFNSFRLVGQNEDVYFSVVMLTFGVCIGSIIWWFALSNIVHILHRKITPNALQWINRVIGVIVTVLGAAILCQAMAIYL